VRFLLIANYRLPIVDWNCGLNGPFQSAIGNRKSEMPNGGQSAECPDRLIFKKAANFFRQIFWE
jgi:hypothetical protein